MRIKDSDTAIAKMRSVIQFQGSLPYVFSGSSRDKMELIFSDPASPFFKAAIAIEVKSHEGLAFRNFLKRKFSKRGRKTSEAFFEAIDALQIQITGDMQQICWALWLSSETGEKLDAAPLDNALDMIFQIERSKYEDTLLNVSPAQQSALVDLAIHSDKGIYTAGFKKTSGISVVGTITKAVKRLEDLRIIYRFQDSYRFANPFFKIWIREHFIQ